MLGMLARGGNGCPVGNCVPLHFLFPELFFSINASFLGLFVTIALSLHFIGGAGGL